MDQIQKNLLEQVAGLHEMPAGAYNIRANGASVERSTTAHIDIVTKEDRQGIDIIIKPGTKKESVHIPVVLSQSGLQLNRAALLQYILMILRCRILLWLISIKWSK